jgi:hypothetical protein
MHTIHSHDVHNLSSFRRVVILLAAAWLFVGLAVPARADDLQQEAAELRTKYAAALEKLAVWCEGQGLAAEAKKSRAALGPHDPYKLYLPVLPREIGPPPLPENTPPAVAQWQEKFDKLRHEQAAALYELARRAIRQRQGSLAYALVLEVIRDDPDHEGVRRLFGYQKYRGGWYTPYEAKKLRSGQVWDERFGWLPKAYVARYQQGQRLSGSRWISAEEDARLHRDIHSGWEVESEHYSIRTNHSIEAAVALGVKLENLYRLWQQIFIRYYATEAYVASLFSGHPQQTHGPEGHRFKVVYFRDRNDYNRALQAEMPNVGISIGIYMSRHHTAYFFAGEGSDQRTLYHEATHQLFSQSRRVVQSPGDKANFWIIEGIAMYMESLHEEDGYFVLGGLDDARMNAARYHLMKEDFYIPFAQLVGLNGQQLQDDPKIATIYSQSAAMANFLVYYDGGCYRDALVSYLNDVYNGHDDAGTLTRLTGSSYAELDKQYRAFMKVDRP